LFQRLELLIRSDCCLCAGLSHDQLEELRRIVKGSGTGVQGHSRFPVENARALLHVAVLQDQHGLSFDEAIKTTAAAELASPSTLRAAILEFASTGMLLHPSTAHRGKGNLEHPLYCSNTEQYGPSLEAEMIMHELIHKQKTEGVSVTSVIIAAELHCFLQSSCRIRRFWLRRLLTCTCCCHVLS